MKNKQLSGSLFGLLARNYLLFTLTLLTIAAGLFLLWNNRIYRLYYPVDWESVRTDSALEEGDYQRLERLLGDNGALAVYDGEGKLLYASRDDFDAWYTPGELSCIRAYGSTRLIDSYDVAGNGSGPRYLLVLHTYTESASEAVKVMALDEDYQVVFGGLGDGRTGYTAEEYALLSGRRYEGSEVTRLDFTDQSGETRTALFREMYISDADYFRSYDESWRIWLLFVPLYLLTTAAFIWWLSRKIGRPLRRLNDAVASQTEGRLVRVGDCGGTREIRRIGESFDRFSDRLAESEAERRRLDEGRQKLIADISHDLKTPITVIAGYIDAICDGKVPPQEQERYLRAIQAKAETLTELVNAFHEYSKVEHPEFVLRQARTDLGEFLREYLAGKYDEVDLAGFTLEVSIPERPVPCELDEMQFRRVLDNLLSNALRHNRLGTVLFFDLEVAEGKAVLRVADNGAGIPPERAKYIFEPFVVGSDARSGKGSGLGLAITRRIIEKHGGTIELNPRPTFGRSTEFILRLPLEGQTKPEEH
ncbi:two-component sensor histidine kinase [Flavonifractor sp. An92]|nr:two-component sensor histidine kinase [Flavonifractor sp. An92]